ncbi:MAG: hypothetical protein ACREBS_10930 [Nitrososphaerales archaeon]
MSFRTENYESGQLTDELEAQELPSENDLVVLKAFDDSLGAQDLSFQGIKRKLGLHQETLSRALHRLQRDGYVERLSHAYRISSKGLSTISQMRPLTRSEIESHAEPYSVLLLRAVLPPDLNVRELIDSLSYKWFGNMRWLGSTQSPDSATLTWMTSDSGLKISVKIKEDTLTIETYPTGPNSISEATRSAFELFDHVSRALKGSARSSSTSNFPKAA